MYHALRFTDLAKMVNSHQLNFETAEIQLVSMTPKKSKTLKILETMAIDYKYNILQRLQSKPHNEYKKYRAQIPIALGISPKTFDSYLYIKENDSKTIPSDRLMDIASILECTAEELYNNRKRVKLPCQNPFIGDSLIYKP